MSEPGAIETGLSRLLERFLALLLLAIFGTVVLLVVLRYVFNTTVVGGNEGALIAFVYTTAIGGALAVARREHIEIRYFVDLMPAGIQRFLGVLQLTLVAIVNFAIVWYSIVWMASTGSYLMPALQLPQIVAQLSVCIGSSLAFVYCLLGIFRASHHLGRRGADVQGTRAFPRDSDLVEERRCAPCEGKMPSVRGSTPELGAIPRTEGVPPSIGSLGCAFHWESWSLFHARGAPSRSPAEGSFPARGAPSRSPAEGSFPARGSPSRSPAEGSFPARGSPSRSPAEGSFPARGSPSRSPAEGSRRCTAGR